MTIEEKAKAYDEAYRIAEGIHRFSSNPAEIKRMEEIFPRLKDSDDEKIRKWLIGYFNQYIIDGMPQVFGNGLNVKDILAWLEKQDEQKEINLVEILKHYPRETELYSPLYGKLWLAEVDEEHEIITCYRYQLNEGCVRAILEQEDTVSFYSNGTTGLPDFNISKDCMLFLYDVEKQGEQKVEVKYVYTKFRIGDVIVEIKPNGYCQPVTVKYVGEGAYSCESDDGKRSLSFPIISQDEYKLVEQKPADKVEPKFKVGDIIRHKEQGFTCRIIAIDTEYRLSECNGTHLPFDMQDAYELVEQKPAWSDGDRIMLGALR